VSDVPCQLPPGPNGSVQEHLDVDHEVRELRRTTERLAQRQATMASELTNLVHNVGRLVDGRTGDAFMLARIERSLAQLASSVAAVGERIEAARG
jgi:hypothetical protein